MIDEYELYHGAVLRHILANCGEAVRVEVDDRDGRIDSFVFNGRIAIHIKHSKKRMPPWQFTFSRRNIEELIDLDTKHERLFICIVCATDGIVALSPQEFLDVSGPSASDVFWIRIDRGRNTMYSLHGNAGRAGSVCLNSFALPLSGILPGLRSRCDAHLGRDAGRA